MGTAFARRGLPGRVSPVPCRAFFTCPPPYPGSVLPPSVGNRYPGPLCGRSLLPSPRHDRLGRFSLSVVPLTGLQGSRFRIGPEKSLPSGRPNGPLRALDAPLRREDFASRRGPATRGGGPLTATGLPPAGSTQQVGPPSGGLRQDAPWRERTEPRRPWRASSVSRRARASPTPKRRRCRAARSEG
jgi:hypothetical protein